MSKSNQIAIKFLAIIIAFCVYGCQQIDDLGGSDDKEIYDLLASLNIVPEHINCTGVEGFALKNSGHETDEPAVRSGASGNDVNLYSVDENGQMTLTVFTYKAVQIQEPDSTVATILQELSAALQVIPAEVKCIGGYVLFSNCHYALNGADYSDEIMSVCMRFLESYGNGFLIRKSDGAMYDVTDSQHWFRTSVISPKGNVYIQSDLGVIYRIEDNGDAIDFRQMTQNVPSLDEAIFFFDDDENIYISSLYGGGFQVYFSDGSYNFVQNPSGGCSLLHDLWWCHQVCIDEEDTEKIAVMSELKQLKNLQWTTVQKHDFYISGRELCANPEFSGYLEPGEGELVSINVKEHGWETDRVLGVFQDCFIVPLYTLWNRKLDVGMGKLTGKLFYQRLYVFINARTGEYEVRLDYPLYDTVRRAEIKDSKYCYNVTLEQAGIALQIFDPIKCTEDSKFFDLPVLQKLVQTRWTYKIVNGDIYIYIDGVSTQTSNVVTAWINLTTGEYGSSDDVDNRDTITYFKIN